MGLREFGETHRDRASVSSAASEPPKSQTWATFSLIAINVAVFTAMAVTSNSIMGFDVLRLAAWGGNSGLLDLSGQWWRLLTYQFLHMNLIHIAVNMWVMWSVGRLSERLYGGFALLFIYVVSGLLAGLVSIVWNPNEVSVGASGSIFGVLGALLSILSFSRKSIPVSALRYWLPALLFAVFSLISGAYRPGIDNAAHVGGLLAGLGVGAVLMRPGESRWGFPLKRGIGAVAFAAICAIPLLWYVGAFHRRSSPFETFAGHHPWYAARESSNLRLWVNLGMQATSQSISEDELQARFEREILPFWEEADTRLHRKLRQSKTAKDPLLPTMAEFARVRLEWAHAIVAATKSNAPQDLRTVLYYAQQTNLVQAKIDRLGFLAGARNLPRPLPDSPLANWIRGLLPDQGWRCVGPPPNFRKAVSATDAPDDGPAQRHATGCLAQRMFMGGEYGSLDAQLKKYAANLSDLPDGSSHYEGVWTGLHNLFAYGKISAEEALRRAAEWRRSVKKSVQPSLVEALIFSDWAYAARGHGYASTVSPRAMATYILRSEMAAESLRDAAQFSPKAPERYVLSIGVDRDLSVPLQKSRAVLDKGTTRYPAYFPLYREMLISLMPRWGGSIDLVENFIVSVSRKAGGGKLDPATYARLYLAYGNLEGDDYNVVESATANPALMTAGLEQLRPRYPKSDYILNLALCFACIDNRYFAYRALRPFVSKHLSSTAWPDKLSVESCDKWAS